MVEIWAEFSKLSCYSGAGGTSGFPSNHDTEHLKVWLNGTARLSVLGKFCSLHLLFRVTIKFEDLCKFKGTITLTSATTG